MRWYINADLVPNFYPALCSLVRFGACGIVLSTGEAATAELSLPFVDAGITDVVLPAQIEDRSAGLRGGS